MGLRILLVAILALAACGTSIESKADGLFGYHSKRHYRSSVPYRYRRSYAYRRSYFGGLGGHLFGWQLEPFRFDTSEYNYPGHYNNHTFWERVQTQGNYPVQN